MNTQTVEKAETNCNAPKRAGGQTFVPSVDIVEYADKFVLLADVPGARTEAIDINYERGQLTLHVRVEPRNKSDAGRWLRREYAVGDYCRSFQIGEGIDASRIQAEVANGVLTLHLPKSEVAKVRKIDVKAA